MAANTSLCLITETKSRMYCYAQRVDLHKPGIVLLLRKPWIHGLFAHSRDFPYIYFNPINSRITCISFNYITKAQKLYRLRHRLAELVGLSSLHGFQPMWAFQDGTCVVGIITS